MKKAKELLEWRVNTPGLLQEIGNNNSQMAGLSAPLNILQGLLAQVAKRSIELNDKELNKLMIRLSLYSIADPKSNEFDLKKVTEYLKS